MTSVDGIREAGRRWAAAHDAAAAADDNYASAFRAAIRPAAASMSDVTAEYVYDRAVMAEAAALELGEALRELRIELRASTLPMTVLAELTGAGIGQVAAWLAVEQ